MNKPIHAKPSLYALYFEGLKEIALKYGYNLVLHGSLNRDLDLIAIPWQEHIGDCKAMVDEFAQELGGQIMWMDASTKNCFPHGRTSYVINLNRRGDNNDGSFDPQYYLDISVVAHEQFLQSNQWTNHDYQIKNQLYNTLRKLGLKSDILSIIGSWKDSMSDEDTLRMLKEFNESKRNDKEESRE